MAGMNVKMPDGTVINNVPEGTTQEQLLQMYSSHKAANTPKYQASEDTVYSPDGTALITPQGIEAGSAGAKKAERVLTDVAGAPVRAAMSVAKPIASVAEMLGTSQPSKALEAIDTGVKEQSGPISTGASIAGDIGAFGGAMKMGQSGLQALKAIPQAGNILSKIQGMYQSLPTMGKLATAGAGSTLLTPTGKAIDEEGYGEERAKQAGFGAVAGPALGAMASGVSRIAAPKLEQLKKLAAEGIDIEKFIKGDSTLGQVLGGGTQAVENFLRIFPGSGIKNVAQKGIENLENLKFDRNMALDRAKNTALTEVKNEANQALTTVKDQTKVVNDQLSQRFANKVTQDLDKLSAKNAEFSAPIINRALSHIDDQLPADVKGTDAIKYTADKISAAYKKALEGVGELRIGDAEAELLNKVGSKYAKTPGIQQEVDNLINLAGDTKLITPEQWQIELSELGQKAYAAATRGGLEGVQQAKALRDLKDAWMQFAEDTVGGPLIKQANKAHADFQAPEKAAGYLSSIKSGGEFNPEQLLQALKANLPGKKFSRGDDQLLKDTVKAYQDMAKERAALDAQHAKWKTQLKEKQAENSKTVSAQKAALDADKNKLTQDINEKTKIDKNKLATVVGDVKKGSTPDTILHKLGYAVTIGPAATAVAGKGIGAAGVPAAGAIGSAMTPLAIGALSVGPATRLAYTMPNQMWKNLATAKRPAQVEAAGRLLRQNLPKTAAAGTVSAMPSQPQNIPEQLQNAYEDATWEGQKAGGLVYLR